MSIAIPLTADSVIQLNSITNSTELVTGKPVKPNLGVFEKDIIEISELGIEKQQKETQVETTKSIDGLANEVVRISSSIGRARSLGNLTSSQATNLYSKIASLL